MRISILFSVLYVLQTFGAARIHRNELRRFYRRPSSQRRRETLYGNTFDDGLLDHTEYPAHLSRKARYMKPWHQNKIQKLRLYRNILGKQREKLLKIGNTIKSQKAHQQQKYFLPQQHYIPQRQVYEEDGAIQNLADDGSSRRRSKPFAGIKPKPKVYAIYRGNKSKDDIPTDAKVFKPGEYVNVNTGKKSSYGVVLNKRGDVISEGNVAKGLRKLKFSRKFRGQVKPNDRGIIGPLGSMSRSIGSNVEKDFTVIQVKDPKALLLDDPPDYTVVDFGDQCDPGMKFLPCGKQCEPKSCDDVTKGKNKCIQVCIPTCFCDTDDHVLKEPDGGPCVHISACPKSTGTTESYAASPGIAENLGVLDEDGDNEIDLEPLAEAAGLIAQTAPSVLPWTPANRDLGSSGGLITKMMNKFNSRVKGLFG